MISRSGLESIGSEGGGYLDPGDWATTIGYRHVYSYVHFVGRTEQTYRQQLGTEVLMKTNLEDAIVTYQVTNRLSCQATLPILSATRRQNAEFGTLHTSGFGDVSAGAQLWLWNPHKAKSSVRNAQLGLSLLAPTGQDRIQNNVIAAAGGSPVLVTPDYSAQPGQGAWGMIMQWQAFRAITGQTTLYTDGNYVMTQGGYKSFGSNHGGAASGPPKPTVAMTQFDAFQDQYLAEIGAAHPAPAIRGLTLTLALRDEGVPARNLIGNDLGFRRPGFAISATPGFIYTRGSHMLQAEVGRAIFRDRTRSVPDKILGTHGDAAFANYLWMVSYTLRLPKRRGGEGALGASNAVGANDAAIAQFPPFNLKTLDGTGKTLQDYANKAILIAFFFPRCPYCAIELPLEQQIYDKYKDQGLSMVWINILPEEEKLIAPWQADHRFNVPVLVGASQDVIERAYRVAATPTTYLLDANGKIVYSATGYRAGDEKTLEAQIVHALSTAP